MVVLDVAQRMNERKEKKRYETKRKQAGEWREKEKKNCVLKNTIGKNIEINNERTKQRENITK